LVEFLQLGFVGEFTVDQQVTDFDKVTVGGQVFDGITAVPQDTLFAVVAGKQTMAEQAKLQIGDTEIDLDVVVGTEEERGINLGKLRQQTGYITLDEGYVNTGSTRSEITFLNGDL